ncbi:hypothetical protein SCP_0508270 [Sparassis crispa]|uniref:RING-type domain-containing protein n=1 Tax=Sparassis crispa TaxID=139825 RepID=A0A401GNF4_9APHY|nr:hypothetical protein SCP_0508270 [Sparassis crispa]GBE83771.1 hypothetical protein SCP_0508270 [Sparassis crispa]
MDDGAESSDHHISSAKFLRSRMMEILPLVRYVPACKDGFTPAPESDDWEDSEFADFPLEDHNSRCYICWEDYQPPRKKSLATASARKAPEPLRQFACGHAFHKRCAELWARDNNKCLLCRRDLDPPEGTQTEAEWSANYNLIRDQKGIAKRAVQLELLCSFEWEAIYDAQFSADSKYLAFECARERVRVVDIATASVIRTFEDGSVCSFCFGPDGQILATGYADGHISIWNGDVVKHALDDHTALVWALEVSTDGRWLMSASHDNTVRIWDTTSGSAVHCMEFPTELEFASISPDGRFIAVDGRLGKVEIWSLEKRTVIKRFKAHRSTVNDAVFTLHGEAVLTGSIDTDLKVWDMSTILTSAAPHSEINENTLESNQSTVLSNSDNVPHSGVFVGHEYSAVSFDISHDGKWVVSGDQRGMVHIWDTKTTAVQCVLRAHAGTSVGAVRISPNNELIVTGDYNGRVRIFKFTAVDSCDEEALRVPAIPFEPPTSGNDRTDSVDATVLPIASSPTQMRVGPDNDHPLLAHDASGIPEQTDHSSPPATGPTHRSSVLVSSSTGVDSAQDARGTLIGSPRKSCGSKVFAKMRRVVDRLRRRVSLRKDER